MDKELNAYSLDDLLYLMARLRDPDRGCPWDQKQSFETILPYTLEEAYEVADAIEKGNRGDLKDELGDLLFQVIFYAQMGREEGSFDFSDIVDGIVTKLVRRHPHVFPNKDLRAFHPQGTEFTDDDVKGQWEQIKAEERALKAKSKEALHEESFESLLDDIPTNMPALNRAEKLQKRAAQHGFDWPEVGPVFDKVEEELAEIKAVLTEFEGKSLRDPVFHQRLQDEMGDVLFCCVNLARFLKVNPEESVRGTNQKFYDRFTYIEKELATRGRSMDDASLEEMDALWDEAKSLE